MKKAEERLGGMFQLDNLKKSAQKIKKEEAPPETPSTTQDNSSKKNDKSEDEERKKIEAELKKAREEAEKIKKEAEEVRLEAEKMKLEAEKAKAEAEAMKVEVLTDFFSAEWAEYGDVKKTVRYDFNYGLLLDNTKKLYRLKQKDFVQKCIALMLMENPDMKEKADKLLEEFLENR